LEAVILGTARWIESAAHGFVLAVSQRRGTESRIQLSFMI